MAAGPRDAETNTATFDTVWAIIRDTHWDPTLGGLDWTAVRTELRPAAEAAANDGALRDVLHQMIGRLGQSHFAILPADVVLEAAEVTAAEEAAKASPPAAVGSAPDAAPGDADAAPAPPAAKKPPAHRSRRRDAHAGRTGATLAALPAPENSATTEAVVTRVDAGSEASNAGLLPGTVVITIDGTPVIKDLPSAEGLQRYERGAIVRARATGEPGSTTTWHVRAPDGTERDVSMQYTPETRPLSTFGNLPAMPVALEWDRIDAATLARFDAKDATIGRIAFNMWFIPVARPFDKAVDALRSSDGIVLDLRGNPGGLGGMAMGIAGHFTPGVERLGTMYTREGELNFVTNPRTVSVDGNTVAVFGGPLAILVDDGTASTSEIFAGGMQFLGRAKIFGVRTAGAALPAIMSELPNGDVFMHAIADYRLPNGHALEAEGVKPDLERTYTHLDYARDGDPVLADAIRWIATERTTRARSAASTTTSTKEPTP